jgi:hypothetical protein
MEQRGHLLASEEAQRLVNKGASVWWLNKLTGLIELTESTHQPHQPNQLNQLIP